MHSQNTARRNTRVLFQSINVLRKDEMKQVLLREKSEERMRERRTQVARFARAGNCVEWLRGVAEIVDVKDCFGVGEFERGEFGVEACLRGAEVGDVGCC